MEFLVIENDKKFNEVFNKLYIQGITAINTNFLEANSDVDFHLYFDKIYETAKKTIETAIKLKTKEIHELKGVLKNETEMARRRRKRRRQIKRSDRVPSSSKKLTTKQKELLIKLFGKPYVF